MKILGVETSTKFLSIGTYDGGKICEYNLEVGIKLSSLITITIKRVLESLNWKVNDIDYFACGLGPGSFTGIRVGVATIKGLAWSLKKPVIGISTLDILARNVSPSDTWIVPMVDAKRNLIYCSVYQNKKGALKRAMPYMLLTEKEFYRKVKPNSIILGDGISLYKEKILKNLKEVNILDKDYWYPQARNMITLALERIKEKKFNHPSRIKPIYLYPKECQIRKNSVERIA